MATIRVPKGLEDLTSLGIASGDAVLIEHGSQTISGGLDMSGFASGLTNLYVSSMFGGTIGSASSPLRVDIDAGSPNTLWYDAGGGAIYYRPNGNNNLCTLFLHTGTGQSTILGGGTVTTFAQTAGRSLITGDVVCVNWRIGGGYAKQEYNSTANTSVVCSACEARTARGFSGTAYVSGGASLAVGRDDISATQPTGGTLVIADASVVWWGGNISQVYLLTKKSRLDLSRAMNAITATIDGDSSAIRASALESKFASHSLTINPWYGDPDALMGGGGLVP